jgi:LPXTG-motif cell wall-anchored protein
MIDQDKLDNQEETITFSSQQDEEYGLPEAEYSPIAEEEIIDEYEEPVQYSRNRVAEPQTESRTTWPIWLGAVVLLLGLAGFALYFFVFAQEEVPVTPPVVERVVEEPEPIFEESEPIMEAEEWVPTKPESGEITTISGRTGRYYVIVGSFIDSDMAADYAVKLSKLGNTVTIIEPTGNRKFYRLAVKDGESFDELNEELDTFRSTFGQDIWVVRY